jgi:hypothetical protein
VITHLVGVRPSYELRTTGSYVYYWPATRQWLVGPNIQSSAAALASATLEATCPDDVPRWLVAAGAAGWVSTYPVAVVPLLGARQTFSPTQPTSAAPTSVGNTPQRSGHLLRLMGFGSQGPSVTCLHRLLLRSLGSLRHWFPAHAYGRVTGQLGSAKSRWHACFPALGRAGGVPSITIGSWRWSCATDCLGLTCGLSLDVGAVVSLNGTLPDAIGSLSCRSKIRLMYETTPSPSQRAGGPAGAARIISAPFHDAPLSLVHVPVPCQPPPTPRWPSSCPQPAMQDGCCHAQPFTGGPVSNG